MHMNILTLSSHELKYHHTFGASTIASRQGLFIALSLFLIIVFRAMETNIELVKASVEWAKALGPGLAMGLGAIGPGIGIGLLVGKAL